MNFLELSDVQRRTVITQASARTGINANLIEKDGGYARFSERYTHLKVQEVSVSKVVPH